MILEVKHRWIGQIAKWSTVFVNHFRVTRVAAKGVMHTLGACASGQFADKLCAKHPNEIPEQHREAILEFAGLDRTVAGSSIASNTRAATAFLEPMTR